RLGPPGPLEVENRPLPVGECHPGQPASLGEAGQASSPTLGRQARVAPPAEHPPCKREVISSSVISGSNEAAGRSRLWRSIWLSAVRARTSEVPRNKKAVSAMSRLAALQAEGEAPM